MNRAESLNHREAIARNQADHFRKLAQEAALAGNGIRAAWMLKEAQRSDSRANALRTRGGA